jgi:Zn-dependent metalloprotease
MESKDKDIRQAATNTMLMTAQLRGERVVRASFAAAVSGNGRRTIYDCQNRTSLSSAVTARSEQGAASSDAAANRGFDGFGATRDFYRTVFDRNSIDDAGMRLDGYVHFDQAYNNAFWDGQRMVFGDGDGEIFTDFTGSLDVIAHELTHGVTDFTAGLEYHNQSGALNESMSDVFGSLVKQWALRQPAAEADWLIGSDIFTPGTDADALRSMKAPGKAYDNPTFGKDPQPDHMSKYVHLPDTPAGDNGGVHINSGIPNKAFFLTAMEIGGFAWEAAGHIWYESLKASGAHTEFQEFADTTYLKAEQLYGTNSDEQRAVLSAWREVGIKVTRAAAGIVRARVRAGSSESAAAPPEEDTFAALTKQLTALSAQVTVLSKEVGALKTRR